MEKPLIYILFIGGAADKESFLWGNMNVPFSKAWPHYLTGKLTDEFILKLNESVLTYDKELKPLICKHCQIDYLSYTEFFEQLKEYIPTQEQISEPSDECFYQITSRICPETKVYIVGPSLGGWNGAHLSCLLSQLNITTVEYLITLDPVGSGNHEFSLINPLIKKALIYTNAPVPIAKNWINIQAIHIDVAKKQTTGKIDDWVAWAGGQWLIYGQYQSVEQQFYAVTNYSHKDVKEMFTYPTQNG